MDRRDLPLATLITERCRELGLSRSELIARCEYKNITKGLRRLDQVYAGNLDKAATLIRNLPEALDLSADIIQQAATDTVRLIAAEEDARWRASFQPEAFLLGTSKRPSQIWMYGISGGAERWLKISLDLDEPPETYAEQALSVVQRTPVVQFFGPTTGFVVNYTPDNAVRFDMEGRPVEIFAHAYRPGEVTLYLGNRELRLRILAEH
ncbi:MAG: hypothetical protein QNK17_00895 [Hyphomicrobiaceae bacterium]|nr:hypothetical protein [Hyphomicrobiaceae bacterium]MDX2448977.1 hypothetical protein [Hyphomicrobiaceae bacterium]